MNFDHFYQVLFSSKNVPSLSLIKRVFGFRKNATSRRSVTLREQENMELAIRNAHSDMDHSAEINHPNRLPSEQVNYNNVILGIEVTEETPLRRLTFRTSFSMESLHLPSISNTQDTNPPLVRKKSLPPSRIPRLITGRVSTRTTSTPVKSSQSNKKLTRTPVPPPVPKIRWSTPKQFKGIENAAEKTKKVSKSYQGSPVIFVHKNSTKYTGRSSGSRVDIGTPGNQIYSRHQTVRSSVRLRGEKWQPRVKPHCCL